MNKLIFCSGLWFRQKQ